MLGTTTNNVSLFFLREKRSPRRRQHVVYVLTCPRNKLSSLDLAEKTSSREIDES